MWEQFYPSIVPVKFITKEELANLSAKIFWFRHKEYFLETQEGNFIWMSPDYGGENVIRKFIGDLRSYKDILMVVDHIEIGEYKIRDYIGETFIFTE